MPISPLRGGRNGGPAVFLIKKGLEGWLMFLDFFGCMYVGPWLVF